MHSGKSLPKDRWQQPPSRRLQRSCRAAATQKQQQSGESLILCDEANIQQQRSHYTWVNMSKRRRFDYRLSTKVRRQKNVCFCRNMPTVVCCCTERTILNSSGRKLNLPFKASEKRHFFKLTYSPMFPELSLSGPQTEPLHVLNVAVRRSYSGNSSSGSC